MRTYRFILIFLLLFTSLACGLNVIPQHTATSVSTSPQNAGASVQQTSTSAAVKPTASATTPLTASATTKLTASAVPTPTASPTTSVKYDVIETIILKNAGSEKSDVTLRVALIQDISPYQKVTSMNTNPPDYQDVTDEYGNQYAEFQLKDLNAAENTTVEINYQVEVNAININLGACEGSLPPDLSTEWVKPEQFIESDTTPILDLSKELSAGKPSSCEKALAFYEYVINNLSYAGYNPTDKGALATLNDKRGDCTDYTDLFTALDRAANIPARFMEGIVCCTKGDISDPGNTKHDWSEIYLPGSGWVPVDPTWGQQYNNHEAYFARLTPDHIIITRGRTLTSLGGYHYFSYHYYSETTINFQEKWIVKKASD